MKKTVCVLLTLLLLGSCTLADEWIGGEGWWDDNYSGTIKTHRESGMTFKLPSGWTYTGYSSYNKMYSYTNPAMDIEMSIFYRDDLGLYDLESQYSFLNKSYDMGMIILKKDRDWYIFADAIHMTAYCTGKTGVLFGMNVYFPRETFSDGSYHVWARRLISSVDDGT